MEIENLKLKELIETEISNMMLKSYPIGSIYLSTANINPSTFLGGTWESWGIGRTIVGVNSNDADFAKSEQTGGAKTVTLTLAQIPKHSHTFTGTAHHHGLNNHTHTYSESAATTGNHTLTINEIPSHNHKMCDNIFASQGGGNVATPCYQQATSSASYTTKAGGGAAHNHGITLTSANSGRASGNTANATAIGTIGESGSGNSHSNLQPYITCYMWKRTA